MPTFAATDLDVITDAIADMTAVYWLPLLAIFGVLLTISLVPRIVKKFARA